MITLQIFTTFLTSLLRYVSLTLGKLQLSCSSNMIQAKSVVGLAGVIIVLCSVACSLGIFSFLGWEATLIVIEVSLAYFLLCYLLLCHFQHHFPCALILLSLERDIIHCKYTLRLLHLLNSAFPRTINSVIALCAVWLPYLIRVIAKSRMISNEVTKTINATCIVWQVW